MTATHAYPMRPDSYDKKVALVLQGGGALGSYQGGVYEALSEGEYLPDWVAGISIGAINAAIIAGNAPEHRVERLRMFWERLQHRPRSGLIGWRRPWAHGRITAPPLPCVRWFSASLASSAPAHRPIGSLAKAA